MILPFAAAPPADTSTLTIALAVLSVIGGSALTVAGGLVGAFIQGRREHRRWLRERRYEAFVKAYSVIKGFDLNMHKQLKLAAVEGAAENDPDLKLLLDQADQLYASVAESIGPITVLGPPKVTDAALSMQLAYEAGDEKALAAAEIAFVQSAREALKARK